jgi:hypothetical protein
MDGMIMSVVSALDGKEAPVLLNGKDSGETMAITLVDKLHSQTVVTMKGKPFGTSKGAFSPDFNTLTVENDFAPRVGGNPRARRPRSGRASKRAARLTASSSAGARTTTSTPSCRLIRADAIRLGLHAFDLPAPRRGKP